MKIAVLGSTRGTDLQGILDAIANNTLWDVDIEFVLSNKKDATILERARQHGLKAIFLDPKGKRRVDYDAEITQLLEAHHVELVVLIGYMKLMSADFVQRWLNKVMNIHPSLLPAFAGGMDRNVHKEVLARGCKVTGASLIFIDEGADTGPIISQGVVPVLQNDTIDTLKVKVQALEQRLLVEALGQYRDGHISVVGHKVLVRS